MARIPAVVNYWPNGFSFTITRARWWPAQPDAAAQLERTRAAEQPAAHTTTDHTATDHATAEQPAGELPTAEH